ncbi:MAG: hypothetical protein ACLUDD_04845 [Lactobacillus kalixensis]|uniref:hypothetical protein n=1 Tax=Lactobacillus kalixensis TaxID=227944 RepID=UPI003991817B
MTKFNLNDQDYLPISKNSDGSINVGENQYSKISDVNELEHTLKVNNVEYIENLIGKKASGTNVGWNGAWGNPGNGSTDINSMYVTGIYNDGSCFLSTNPGTFPAYVYDENLQSNVPKAFNINDLTFYDS